MNLYNLSSVYNTAKELLEECKEYKEVQNLKTQINEELKRLKSLPFPANKETLMNFGFECRTGYEIKLEPPDLNESTEEWTHIIIHKSQPSFKLVWFSNSYEGLNIEFGEQRLSDHWSYDALGLGGNEEKAWEDALGEVIWNWEQKGNLSTDKYINT
jgi:hypothetical protein